jgi:hypothetical protein
MSNYFPAVFIQAILTIICPCKNSVKSADNVFLPLPVRDSSNRHQPVNT